MSARELKWKQKYMNAGYPEMKAEELAIAKSEEERGTRRRNVKSLSRK